MNLFPFLALVSADSINFNRGRNSAYTHLMKQMGSYPDSGIQNNYLGMARIVSYPNERRDRRRYSKMLFIKYHQQN